MNNNDKGRAFELMRNGKPGEARELLVRLCNNDSPDAETHMALGIAEGMLGHFAEAVTALRHTVDLAPGLAGAHFNLAKALQAQGDLDGALESYIEACRLQPDCAGFHNNLGNAQRESGHLREARAHLEQATELEPGNAVFHYNLGNIMIELGLREQAVAAFERALTLDPAFVSAWISLGGAQQALGDTDAAMIAYDRGLALQPAHADALASKAGLLNNQGQFEEAMQLLRPHLSTEAVDAGIATTFAQFAHHLNRAPEAVELIERLLPDPRLSSRKRARLGFALAGLYDRNGHYDEAFAVYKTANEQRRKPYDNHAQQQIFDQIPVIWSQSFMKSAPRASCNSELPVFIVGMPRSGTSLVEQILASHRDVHGAGELSLLGNIAESVQARINDSNDPHTELQALLEESADKLASRYLATLTALATGAQRITDKMPANFMHLGLVELLLPKAVVIHCKRDPLDTCLSCYFQDFAGDHPYANDLTSLGQYYSGYARLMQYWQSVLGIPILEVEYEALVTRPEAVIPEIIRFCGLEPDDACLDFHASRRTVVTASYDQVRQPLYTRSIGRWRNYEKHIGRLKTALSL